VNLGFWSIISMAVAIGISLIIVGMAIAVLIALFNGTINLTYLLAEPADPVSQQGGPPPAVMDPDHPNPSGVPVAPPEVPKASLSRFQFLVFTFVIAGTYLVLCLESGRFVEIPQNVVLLLGVSGTSYAASKGIKAAADSSRSADAGGVR
jgi:hypothetical protein